MVREESLMLVDHFVDLGEIGVDSGGQLRLSGLRLARVGGSAKCCHDREV